MATIDESLSDGRRVYVRTKFGEPVVAELKRMGAHWDAESKAWWLGAAKRAEVQALLKGPANLDARDPVQHAAKADMLEEAGKAEEAAAVRAAGPEKENVDDCRAYAQVTYKGRRYYVIAEQRDKATREPLRCRLTTLDGLAPFWVDCQACELVRTYEGREVWDGRRYSGKTRTVYSTIGSLRAFRDRQRQGEKDGLPACSVCGKRSANLVHDLETSLQACRGCADMPAD